MINLSIAIALLIYYNCFFHMYKKKTEIKIVKFSKSNPFIKFKNIQKRNFYGSLPFLSSL